MVKIQMNKTGQFWITLPKEYIMQTKWHKGDVLTISFNERGNLELRK